MQILLLANWFSWFGMGCEWAVNIQRDSYASYVGHYPMLAYFSIAENESIGRERYEFMQPGAVYASQSLKFAAPVHVGDEVVAQVQALHIKATGARHIVKFATRCFMDDEETLAIDGEAMAFLPTLQLSTEAIE
uniref:Thioesterase domain-containing protein n=1 Tax=Aegilops tauschii TaxID=37682 RepID=N1QTT6_AEGTA